MTFSIRKIPDQAVEDACPSSELRQKLIAPSKTQVGNSSIVLIHFIIWGEMGFGTCGAEDTPARLQVLEVLGPVEWGEMGNYCQGNGLVSGESDWEKI